MHLKRPSRYNLNGWIWLKVLIFSLYFLYMRIMIWVHSVCLKFSLPNMALLFVYISEKIIAWQKEMVMEFQTSEHLVAEVHGILLDHQSLGKKPNRISMFKKEIKKNCRNGDQSISFINFLEKYCTRIVKQLVGTWMIKWWLTASAICIKAV